MTKSKVFCLLLLSFVGGVFLCSINSLSREAGEGIFLGGLIITIFALIKKDKIKLLWGICVLFLVLGLWRTGEVFSYQGEPAIKNLNPVAKMIFSGKIVEEPDRRMNFSQYVLESGAFGRVLIRTDLYPEYFYGDALKINGKVGANKFFRV